MVLVSLHCEPGRSGSDSIYSDGHDELAKPQSYSPDQVNGSDDGAKSGELTSQVEVRGFIHDSVVGAGRIMGTEDGKSLMES